jgi:hypothetical protein
MVLLPPCYTWYALGTRSFRSVVGSWCPGLGAANSGTLKPVDCGSIAYVKVKTKKKAAVLKTRRIMPRAGAAGDADRAAGGKARSTEA